MREKRRNGRVTTKTSVEDEIVHLRGLDLKGLRARWQSVLTPSANALTSVHEPHGQRCTPGFAAMLEPRRQSCVARGRIRTKTVDSENNAQA